MRLLYSPTSPYARKVRVTAAEKGLTDKIEVVTINPFDDIADLGPVNPVGKVPALVMDSGTTLYDSPVICEYLDSLGGGASLLPASGEARWTVLRQQALADGVLDAAFSLVMEMRRPEGERSQSWIDRWTAGIYRSVDAIDAEAGSLSADVTLAHVAFGCALGYLDFRLGDLNWRDGRANAAAWYETFGARPSMTSTDPDS